MSFEEDNRMADIPTQIYREIHVKQTKALLDTSGRKGMSKGGIQQPLNLINFDWHLNK